MVLVRVAGCTRGTMESDAARVFVRDGRRTLCWGFGRDSCDFGM